MTRQKILNQLQAYLNHQTSLPQLVAWAEDALLEPVFIDDEDADLLMNILMYLGAADSRGFPLTWEILSDFMDKLGGNVRVIVEMA